MRRSGQRRMQAKDEDVCLVGGVPIYSGRETRERSNAYPLRLARMDDQS